MMNSLIVYSVEQKKIAEPLEVDLNPKRGVGRQVHRENAAPDTSTVKLWRINLFPLYRSRNIRNGDTFQMS